MGEVQRREGRKPCTILGGRRGVRQVEVAEVGEGASARLLNAVQRKGQCVQQRRIDARRRLDTRVHRLSPWSANFA
jgi:hypothetical protein